VNFDLFYSFHFYLFGVIAIASALMFVTRKGPVAAAMWLVTTMFALAAIYVLLSAEFIGVIQVLVYAGAIMVLFLFVVMLLNLGSPAAIADMKPPWTRIFAAVVALVLVAMLMTIGGAKLPPDWVLARQNAAAIPAGEGIMSVIARPLFSEYVLAFELAAVLLLVAIVGAVLVGRTRR
jgi:NADH-quinone oxidoreductase subunit J